MTRYFARHSIRLSTRSEVLSILSATVLGLLSPLPTYTAIPVALSLPTGVPFSGCSYGVYRFVAAHKSSVFFLTAAQLGMEMAMVRTGAALLIGVVAGGCIMKMPEPFFRRSNIVVPVPVQTRQRTLGMELYRNSLYHGKIFLHCHSSQCRRESANPAGDNFPPSGYEPCNRNVGRYRHGHSVLYLSWRGNSLYANTHDARYEQRGNPRILSAGPATKIETLYAFKAKLGLNVLMFYLVLTLVFSFITGYIYSFF